MLALHSAIGRVQMFKRKSVLLISGPIASGRVDWPCRSSRIKVEIWELPCLRSISLSLSPSTERTTIIIIIISRLSHGGSRFRKVGSRREGGRVKDTSKVGMRGAESEMMNAREGVAFKTRSLHGCLRRVALINERCYREWGEGCGRGKEDRSKATALLRRGGRVALTIVS